jgi:uncharacterized secreted protein with C-terminal beta-propeller domain
MKKIIILITFLFSLGIADSVLLVKKGWQLIGSSVALDNMSKFTEEHVEQVWHFDAATQKWLAYSPDTSIQTRISDKNISKLSTLKNWHGFWLKSKKDWTITFEDKELTAEPNQNISADIIKLKKGWNLISLPVDTVVSANIFDGLTAWKYNDNVWELSDSSGTELNFPKLGHIKNSDGIWVKVAIDQNISVSQEASKLHNFENKEAMETYITEMAKLYQRPYCGIEPFSNNEVPDFEATPVSTEISVASDSSTAGSSAENTSSTNLQENNVDEADILKHNGQYVFYVGKTNGRRDHINVSSFKKLANKEQIVLDSITFSEEVNIDSFYLVENKLIVLSSLDTQTSSLESSPEELSSPYPYTKAQSMVHIFDISTIENITKVSEYTLDGSLKNSRVIGNNLYLISNFSPEYSITYPKEYLTPSSICIDYLNYNINDNEFSTEKYADCFNIVKENERYFRYNYDAPNVKITDLTPDIEGTSLEKQVLVKPTRLYAPTKQKQPTNIMSISIFSIDEGKYLKTTSYIGNSTLEYASSKSLYLVSNEYPYYYDFNNYKSRSQLYKFNFNEDLSYKAVGSVYGTALNQFSLSEYNDILRIATTEGFSWENSGTKNSLYTLKEENALLTTEGVLTGLGKAGETIKSVRFMGDKAYLVTFRITDPLYTIDLSNPKEPKKMGELEINGYSAYLHPIGNDKLLGIGQDTDENGQRKGVKIELFDISDFQNPSSLDSITLSEGTYSELESNHKALAYRNSDHLFAFPFSNYGTDFNNFQQSNHLGIYQVDNNALKSYEGLQENGQSWGEHRGLIFDLNNTTYISFFSDDTVITKELTAKEN